LRQPHFLYFGHFLRLLTKMAAGTVPAEKFARLNAHLKFTPADIQRTMSMFATTAATAADTGLHGAGAPQPNPAQKAVNKTAATHGAARKKKGHKSCCELTLETSVQVC
jgi:hypothetical protein